MAEVIRCAVYTRKSSEEGLEQSFNSLHAQREACEAYVLSQKHEGWQLLPTAYDDGGFSGGSMERPGLKALLADVEAGLVDTIVVYKVDRLTRSLPDFAKIVDRFDAKKVSFVSVTQAFNTTTSMGRLTLNVLLSFAQFEREVTGERIRDKIAQSKAKGMWMGGAVPLGYDVKDRLLVVNEPEAAQVRDLFNLYLACGSADEVIATAAKAGIKSKVRTARDGSPTGGTTLRRGSLYAMLANPIYNGEIGHKANRYPGQHIAVVDPVIFAQVQAMLEGNRRKRGGAAPSAKSPLSGRVFDEDGERLVSTHTSKGGTKYRYYSGAGRRVPAAELEDLIASTLADRLATPALLAAVLPSFDHLTSGTIIAAEKLSKRLSASKADRSAALRLVVTNVVVTDSVITPTITLAPLGIGETKAIGIAASVAKPRERLTLVVPGAEKRAPDAALIGMVAQAREWFDRLASGRERSCEEIAKADGITPAYVRQLIDVAFLAPDLVTAIVEGRQPMALTAARLKEMLPLPSAWTEQRRTFLGSI